MPRGRLHLKKETRMLGIIQIMNSLICNWLGLLWVYLLVTQSPAFGKEYFPFSAQTGFPMWSSASFFFSGLFTVLLEKTRSRSLVSCTIAMNILSACNSTIGMLLLMLELVNYEIRVENSIWPHQSGVILSEYLFLFNTLELIVACVVTHWIYKATYRR